MTDAPNGSDGDRNLVSADIFFGLGAILLIVIALLSFGLQTLVTSMATPTAMSEDAVETALMALSETRDLMIIAEADGARMLRGGADEVIPLNDVAGSAALRAELATVPLIVVLPDGLEANFLIMVNAASAGIETVDVLRLPPDCISLAANTSGTLSCERP